MHNTNKGMTFPPEPLTPEEIRDMLECADTTTPVGIRIRAIIGTIFGSAIRINECLSLLPRDINNEEGSVFVRRGKGSKDRRIGIDPYGLELVNAWKDKRAELIGPERGKALFCGYRGTHKGVKLSRRYVADQLKTLGLKAGIEKRIHPHGFRHSAAYDLANRNVPIHQLQRQLGHSSLQMTSKYISHLNPSDLYRMMGERNWNDE